MAEIEKPRKKSGKSKARKEEVSIETSQSESTTETSASEQLKALVEAAQVEWQMAEDGIEFTEALTDSEAASDEAQASAELSDAAPTSEDEIEAEMLADDGGEAIEAETTMEASDEAIEFIESEQAISIIESLLFSSDKPVSVGTFKQVFKGTNIKTKDITRALDGLASEYASQKRGVAIEEINGGYQLRTKSDNAEYLRRLSKTRPFKLSGPALEVLSIVAYKQPVVKIEIDQIRGVESGHLLRALMERGLVAFAGKSELPGKPMQYQTTRKFLEIFGLRNLRELPTLSEIDELIPEGIGEETEKKETLSDLTGVLSKDFNGTYSEGEEDLLKITDQLRQIDTSSEFFEQEKVRQREKRDFERAQNIREALTVGEAVDPKDQKWLARYEAKLAEASIQAQAASSGATDTIVSSSEMNPDAELEALATVEEQLETANTQDLDSEMLFEENEASVTESEDELESSDDLSAMPDWDEEK